MLNPESIVLTREQHVNEIMSRWQLQRIDDAAKDALYDEQLRAVSYAMCEPQPLAIDWTDIRHVMGAIALNFFGLAFGLIMLWEMLRP